MKEALFPSILQVGKLRSENLLKVTLLVSSSAMIPTCITLTPNLMLFLFYLIFPNNLSFPASFPQLDDFRNFQIENMRGVLRHVPG